MSQPGQVIRVHATISGRVQGVWYRGSMAERARELALAGWVRNRADGRVEAVIEGPRVRVEELLAWCRKGPAGARVQALATREENAEGLEGFNIAY